MKTAGSVIFFLIALALGAFAAVYGWAMLGEVRISLHGFIAMGLAVVLSLALGAGLMFLVFYSSRHGHDDDPKRPPGFD